MLLVTGGAGFIGSNVVAALNDAGRTDVAVCDILGHDGKWHNLAKRQLADFVPPAELMDWLKGRRLDAVIHLGAISETTATDGDLVIETNFRLSMRLLDWCTANATPLIYASSAATYGDGERGFRDDQSVENLKKLRPMNLYGWSKHLFDMAVAERAARGEKLHQMRALGFERFAVAGHDRGGRVGYRLALDHPGAVSALAVLDILPTADVSAGAGAEGAMRMYHWYFCAAAAAAGNADRRGSGLLPPLYARQLGGERLCVRCCEHGRLRRGVFATRQHSRQLRRLPRRLGGRSRAR